MYIYIYIYIYICVHTFITPISHCMLHMLHPMAMVLSEHFVSQKNGKRRINHQMCTLFAPSKWHFLGQRDGSVRYLDVDPHVSRDTNDPRDASWFTCPGSFPASWVRTRLSLKVRNGLNLVDFSGSDGISRTVMGKPKSSASEFGAPQRSTWQHRQQHAYPQCGGSDEEGEDQGGSDHRKL